MAKQAQHLIDLSLAKITQSRYERRGVSLHKNLLVSTVLQKAKCMFMEEISHVITRYQFMELFQPMWCNNNNNIININNNNNIDDNNIISDIDCNNKLQDDDENSDSITDINQTSVIKLISSSATSLTSLLSSVPSNSSSENTDNNNINVDVNDECKENEPPQTTPSTSPTHSTVITPTIIVTPTPTAQENTIINNHLNLNNNELIYFDLDKNQLEKSTWRKCSLKRRKECTNNNNNNDERSSTTMMMSERENETTDDDDDDDDYNERHTITKRTRTDLSSLSNNDELIPATVEITQTRCNSSGKCNSIETSCLNDDNNEDMMIPDSPGRIEIDRITSLVSIFNFNSALPKIDLCSTSTTTTSTDTNTTAVTTTTLSSQTELNNNNNEIELESSSGSSGSSSSNNSNIITSYLAMTV